MEAPSSPLVFPVPRKLLKNPQIFEEEEGQRSGAQFSLKVETERNGFRPNDGPLVKWLRHGPFTAVTWVRIPYGSPPHKTP